MEKELRQEVRDNEQEIAVWEAGGITGEPVIEPMTIEQMAEGEALLNIAEREEAEEIEAAQIAARKKLRAEAQGARERLDEQNKQITADLKAAIAKSDADVILSFQQARHTALKTGRLGQRIMVTQ